MRTPLSASAATDHLAVLIVLATVVLVLTRVMRSGYEATLITICFGSPFVIGLYFLLKHLLGALAGG
jgi:hypothetical protein